MRRPATTDRERKPTPARTAEKIGPLTPDHLGGCAALWVSVFNREPWNEHWTLDSARQRLSDIMNTPGYVGVVVFETDLVGYAAGYCEQWDAERIFYLKDIVVTTELQRGGIGTKLMRRLEKTLGEMNVEYIYLLAERTAEGFYAKNGYQTGGMHFMARRL